MTAAALSENPLQAPSEAGRAPSEARAPISRERPLPETLAVQEARDAYLRENGFTVAAYEEPFTKASFFGVDFKVPNTKKHRWAIMLHDLHHVATGYGTDLAGEAEVSAWELRRGLRNLGLYVGSIVSLGALGGMLLYPRRTLEAWRRGAGTENLFQDPIPYDELLALDVGALRERLGLPKEGIAPARRGLHPRAPRHAAHEGEGNAPPDRSK